MTTIETEIETMRIQVDRFKQRLAEKFTKLPDNPRIKRLSRNAFVISSSELTTVRRYAEGKVRSINSNWSPEFHDFLTQYRCIEREIMKKDITRILPFLQEIVTEGKIRDREAGCTMTFHPDVVKFVADIINEN